MEKNQCFTLLDKAGVKLEPSKLKDSTLVLIDIQNEYLSNGNVPLTGVDEAISESKILLERARKLKCPIVHVVHNGPKGSGFYDPETKGGQIVDIVSPIDGEPVIVKTNVSSFVNTSMKETLEGFGRKELVVIGFMTHMCVSTFVRAAVEQYGYKCTVVASCTATRDLPSKTIDGGVVKAKEVQESNISALADFFAVVVPTINDLKDE